VYWIPVCVQAFAKHWKGLVKGLFSKNFIASYDMLMSIAPAYVISLFAVFFNIFGIIALSCLGYEPHQTLIPFLVNVLGAYLLLFSQSLVCTMTEWRQIRAPWYKKILYAFTFPFYIFSYIPMAFIALFVKRIEWKPIPHSEVNEEEAKSMGEKAEIEESDEKSEPKDGENQEKSE